MIVYNIEYIIQKVLFKPFYLIFVNRLNKVDKNEFRVFWLNISLLDYITGKFSTVGVRKKRYLFGV